MITRPATPEPVTSTPLSRYQWSTGVPLRSVAVTESPLTSQEVVREPGCEVRFNPAWPVAR
jgi:hypothetical protein